MSEDTGCFLVVYDYGQGGLWWWITARSPAEIMDVYRDVQVLERPPEWWTAEHERVTPRIGVREPDAALTMLMKVR